MACRDHIWRAKSILYFHGQKSNLLSIRYDCDLPLLHKWLIECFLISFRCWCSGNFIEVDDGRLGTAEDVSCIHRSRFLHGLCSSRWGWIADQIDRGDILWVIRSRWIRRYFKCSRAKCVVLRVDTADGFFNVPAYKITKNKNMFLIWRINGV